MVRAIRLLNLRRTRRQPLRSLIAIVTIGAGVSLAVSVVILTTSISTSLNAFGRRLAGPAPLRVVGATSRGGLDASVLTTVDRVPGVAAAVPMVQAVTYTGGGPPTTVVSLGVDCRVEALIGPFGCSPSLLEASSGAPRPLAISASLAHTLASRRPLLRTDQGQISLAGVPALAALDRINHGNVAVFALPVAQRLFARAGRLDAIYVIPAHGTTISVLRSRLAAAIGGWNGVLTAADPPPGTKVVAGVFVPLFSLLSLFAMGIGAVLVYNTISLSLEERRRDLAIVGALGGTPRTIIGGAMIEAGILGLAGGLLGCVGGVILAHPLSTSVSDFTRKFAGVSVTVHASATALIFGAVVGAVVGAGAAWIPARRATRLDVSAELSMRELAEERAPRARTRRAVLAALVALGGILLSWLANRNGSLQPWQARAAPFAAVITSVGLLLTIGALASVLASALRGAVRSNGTTALGVANLVRDPGRTGVMAIAIGAAIGTAFLVASSHQSIHDAIAQGVSTGNPREVRVATLSPNNTINVDAKPSAQLIARLARVPGVAAVDRGISLVTGHAERDLIGVTAFDQPWLNDTMLRGRKDPVSFEQGHVLVGAALARDQHLRPGSRVRLDTPTGYAWVSVGGVWADGNFNGRVVDMPMTLFQRLFGNQPPDGVGLIAAPDTPPDVLAARIVAAHLDPYVSVDTPAQLTSRLTRDISRQLAPFDALQRGLLLVAFIAVLSTLLLVGVQRRRELALLAAVGMEPGQLGRMTLAEALAVACIGLVASIVGAVGMNVAFTFIVPILVGYRDPMRFDFGSLAVWAPVAVLVVMAAALLPAWRTSRVEVLAGLQYE